MKHLMSIVVFVVAMVTSSFAADIESDGLYYKILSYDDHTIELIPSEGIAYSGSITIPAAVDYANQEWTVVSIGDNAFYESTTLQGCVIPSTVRRIGSGTFYKCKEVQTPIVIPEGVTIIDGYAFTNGTKVSLNLPSTLVSIGEWAFCNANTTGDIVIPENVIRIESMAFAHLKANVILNERVEYIGGGAFCENTVVNRVVCPESLIELDGHVFQGCTALTEIILPSKLKKLGTYANSTSLSSITMPDSIKFVDDNAFYGCTNLSSISWSNFIHNVGSRAFYNTAVTEVAFPDSLKQYETMYNYRVDTLFMGDRFVLNKVITDTIGVFITNNGKVTIGSEAFSNCNYLNSVRIKKNTASVASKAFYGSNNITSVISDIRYPSNISDDTFSPEVYSNATLYVHYGRKVLYEDKTGWKNFNHIIEMEKTAEDVADELAEAQAEAERQRIDSILQNKYEDYMRELAMQDSINQAIQDSINNEINNTVNTAFLSASSTSIHSGDTITIFLNITNESKITAFQADVTFANEFVIDASSVSFTDRAGINHSLSKTINGNFMRLVALSFSNDVFYGNSDAIVTMKITTSEDLESGCYAISLSNVELSDSTGRAYKVENSILTIEVTKPGGIIAGDINGDGNVSVDDVVNIVNYIIGTNDGIDQNLADVDGNGEITINDIVVFINLYILGGNNMSRSLAMTRSQNSANLFSKNIELQDGIGIVNVFLNTDYTDIVGLQCDIELSENYIITDNLGNGYINKSNVLDGKLVFEKLLDNRKLRIVVVSIDGSALPSGSETLLFSIGCMGDGEDGVITLSNIDLSNGTPIHGTDSSYMIKSGSTGIGAILSNKDTIEGFYNLQGRRVAPNEKGIVIVKYFNGTSKKVVNR